MIVLVDSSVWIAALKSNNKETFTLKKLLKTKEVVVTAKPIQTEVCQGAKTDTDFYRIWNDFFAYRFLELDDEVWDHAAYLFFRSRKQGVHPGTLDCVLAALAAKNQTSLWTLDRGLMNLLPIAGVDCFRA